MEGARPEYVGFWKRFVAFVIDTLLITVVVAPLMFVLGLQAVDLEGAPRPPVSLWDLVINLTLTVAVILFWKFRGATPGKMAISAKIVDANTLGKPSTARLVVRYFAYLVSMLPLMLGFLWIGIDRRKQGFHDKIAGTVVVTDED